MDDIDIFKSWFKENNTQDIEVFVPDMAGIARGKVIPTQKFCKTEIKKQRVAGRGTHFCPSCQKKRY